MSNNATRRTFLKQTVAVALGLAGAGSAQAVEPFRRGGSSRMLLGLAAYSFRDYFVDSSHKRDRQVDASKRIDLFQFVDYCAEHGCQGAELTSYYFPAEFNSEFLLKLKRHAFLRGVTISGSAVGNTFTYAKGEKRDREIATVKRWVDHCQILGAPHVRVFAGNAQGTSKEEAKRICLEALHECADYAATKGVFLGLENHGGIVAEADDLLELVKAVNSPWVGINLDSANFHTNDVYGDFAQCAPYAVNVQLKTEIQPRNRKKESADLGRFIRILRDANYQGFVTLEYEAAEDPAIAVPDILAQMRDLLKAS